MGGQIKSKRRVADHGEVFTADREVNAMLDLVKQETERIDSRFLEPACGDGNFLSPWADKKRYRKYGLTKEEIAFIESMIRPMDLGGTDDEEHCKNK
ncbi:MAG: hypothetical protein WCZ43_12885 [Proteiniphilum sp.]